MPFYTTPQGRGVIPEDHKYCYLTSRAAAFREADLILVVGTRMNYVIGHAAPPRWNAAAKIVRIDIDPIEIASRRAASTSAWSLMPGSPSSSSRRRSAGKVTPAPTRLARAAAHPQRPEDGRSGAGALQPAVADPSAAAVQGGSRLHGPRCVLCVDGQEILNFGRQAIPQFTARHRINSGAFGTMGVGMPFGIGAKVALPDKQVIVLHGDGSFGMNAMEFDTAVRHNLPIITVISQNGGWTGDPQQGRSPAAISATRVSTSSPKPRRPRRVGREARGHPPGAGARQEGDRGRQAGARLRRHRLQRARDDDRLHQLLDLTIGALKCKRPVREHRPFRLWTGDRLSGAAPGWSRRPRY